MTKRERENFQCFKLHVKFKWSVAVCKCKRIKYLFRIKDTRLPVVFYEYIPIGWSERISVRENTAKRIVKTHKACNILHTPPEHDNCRKACNYSCGLRMCTVAFGVRRWAVFRKILLPPTSENRMMRIKTTRFSNLQDNNMNSKLHQNIGSL
jgi:hypothetical protein